MQPLFACFTQNLNYALGWMVVHSLWQATVIAITAGIVSIILRKKKAGVRYWIYNAALVSVLISAVLTFCFYYDFSLAPPTYRYIPEAVAEPIAGAQGTVAVTTEADRRPLSIEGLTDYFNHHAYLIVTIWVLGVAVFILRLLGSISYVYVLRSRLNFPADEYWTEMMDKIADKAGLTQTVNLVESALVRSPMVIGHLKPLILFPIGAINRLNPQEVEAILAHELAHILRSDYLFNIIQSVIEALFYFHPAVWWISANIRTERENACDDVAIDLCGNSMTYARALVLLQEMAFYPSPQMAMGFAGRRKNQLLHRVQRILNQPQNRSNVMEKLVATLILFLTMIGLSIGSERSMNNSILADSPIEPIEYNEPAHEASVSTSLSAEKPADSFLKFYKDGKLDSLKLDFELNDGNYNYADKFEKVLITIKNNTVVGLSINGIHFKSEQIPNFDRKLYYILKKMPNAPRNDADENSPAVATSPDGTNSYIYSTETPAAPAAMAGSHAPEPPTPPTAVITEGSAPVVAPTPPSVVWAPNRARTYISDGENRITTYDNDGTKHIFRFDTEGGKRVQIFKNENDLAHEITLHNGKVYLDGRQVKEADIKALGWELKSNGLQKIGGYANIQPTPKTYGYGYPKQDYSKADEDEIEDRIDRIEDKIDALKDAFDDCDCQHKDSQWFTWAKARLACQPALIESNKNSWGLQSIENELAVIEKQFKKIKSQKGSSECQGCPTGAGSSNQTYSYASKNDSPFKSAVGAALRRDKLMGDEKTNFYIDTRRMTLNGKEMPQKVYEKYRDMHDDHYGSFGSGGFLKLTFNDNGGGSTNLNFNSSGNPASSFKASGNGYSYGTGNSFNDAEKARKDAEVKSKRNQNEADGNSRALRSLFANLEKKGYISFGKKCSIEFDNRALRVNDDYINTADYEKIKKEFESKLSKKQNTYSVSFKGIIRSVTEEGLNLSGSMNTSMSSDD
jgi:beta-lactamase regulating signal transducer with metallopeptidase domain